MRRRLLVGLVAAMAACLSGAPAAVGVQVSWRNGALGADSKDASSSYPELRTSKACADRSWFYIRAAAHYPGSWSQYGDWGESLGGCACHSYAANQTLGALIWNPHSVTQDPVPGTLRSGYQELPC